VTKPTNPYTWQGLGRPCLCPSSPTLTVTIKPLAKLASPVSIAVSAISSTTMSVLRTPSWRVTQRLHSLHCSL